MRTIELTFTAGQSIEVFETASMFMLLSTISGVDVQVLQMGAEISYAKNMEFGFWTRPKSGFTSVRITSAAAQTIKLSVGEDESGYTRMTGVVQILNQQGVFTHSQSSVTNADSTIKAANNSRRYLMVQNNSTTSVMRLKLDGTAATATSGLRIQPGQFYEAQGYAPSGAIHAFMETADATINNVELVEA